MDDDTSTSKQHVGVNYFVQASNTDFDETMQLLTELFKILGAQDDGVTLILDCDG